MSLYGVVFAAIARKVANLLAEIRKLSAAAAATEKQIIHDAEEEVSKIRTVAASKTAALRDDLIEQIASL